MIKSAHVAVISSTSNASCVGLIRSTRVVVDHVADSIARTFGASRCRQS